MDFQWMEDIPRLKRLKDAVDFRRRAGEIIGYAPKLGLVPPPDGRPSGISAMMRLRNESRWVETAIRSLTPFVEQFSIVDHGSEDGTADIVRRTADKLGLDYTLVSMPDAEFADVCDTALRNTTHRWVLRWDGDMIARTSGELSFATIREYALSLDPARYWAVYFPHICLDGDLFHQDPAHTIHYEDYLFTWSPALFHRRTGRFREMVCPLYYTRCYLWESASFHLSSLDDPVTAIHRKYWEEWRRLNDPAYPTLASFADSCIRGEYGTDSPEEAGALLLREQFRRLVPYDRDRFGDYPELLEPYLASFPHRLVYRDGRITGRSDFMDTLDCIDERRSRLSVDVIIPTRNRPALALDTARALLEQEYPAFGVIVVDQSDVPSDALMQLAGENGKLRYHATQSRGLPAARNEGIGLSQADIVVFVDDDVIPEPGFIRAHARAYHDKKVGAAGGKVIEARPERRHPLPSSLTGAVNWHTGAIHRGFDHDLPMEIQTAPGGNMSFRREVIVFAGGFDTRFGGAYLFEETDTCLAVRRAGYIIRYVPEAALTHLAADSGGCRIDAPIDDIYWYARNFTLLFCKQFPKRALPGWLLFRLGKFARDAVKSGSIGPVSAGMKGMRDGFKSFRNV